MAKKSDVVIEGRKGARRRSEIPGEVVTAINRGETATVNLVEFLAADFAVLAENAAKAAGMDDAAERLARAAKGIADAGVMTRMVEIGRAFGGLIAKRRDKKRVFAAFARHPSDIVRGWAAYALTVREDLTLRGLLDGLRPFAADPHFGVREFAWFAGRDRLIAELDDGIAHLTSWSLDEDPNIRRFASEISRPRGVWCAHINELKEEPERALSILEPLKSDPAKYVQDSVANWLNDASKSRADWVKKVTSRWKKESKTPETAKILKRALRTIEKGAKV